MNNYKNYGVFFYFSGSLEKLLGYLYSLTDNYIIYKYLGKNKETKEATFGLFGNRNSIKKWFFENNLLDNETYEEYETRAFEKSFISL